MCLDLEEVDDALDHLAVLDLLARGRADPQRLPEQLLSCRLRPGHDVVEDGHAVNSAMFWKVRAMPCSATLCGRSSG